MMIRPETDNSLFFLDPVLWHIPPRHYPSIPILCSIARMICSMVWFTGVAMP